MLHNHTFGSDSTGANTRVTTLLIGTCFGEWTIRVYSTFRATSWRTSYIVRYTRAHSLAIDFPALTVRSTRWWMARILNNWS